MDVVGGYRLVRKLGEGERAEVYLGHAGPGEPADAERTAAIKVYRSTTSVDSIDEEIEALARSSSRHLLALRDLAIAPNGYPSLVLPRLGSSSLARLVETRSSLEAGEVVTALAPIAAAVGELHRVGVAHGRVRLSRVLLDPSGAPILAGFGSARVIGPLPSGDGDRSLTPAQLEKVPYVLEDLVGLAESARGLLDSVDTGDHRREVADLLEWLDETDSAANAHDFSAQLSERLFDLAPALPLRVRSADDEGVPRRIPQRTTPPSAPHPGDRSDPVQRKRLAGIPLPEWVDEVLGASLDSHPLAALRTRVILALAPVRRSVWIAGGAGLIAVVIAIVVLSGQGSSAAPETAASHTPAQAGAQPITADEGAAEDPMTAAKALLAARDSCISQRSVICLDRVDQKDSAAMEADVALIRRLQEGANLSKGTQLGGVELRLVQQLGASAIIGFTTPAGDDTSPASLLMLKSEVGWRIRDLILG
ncbi:MAG: hypothetical protein JWO18_1786 [Microbacteriaceae bacterium]|nr:hypothetical protein [Microbacteriaceae bacterium]